MGIDQLRRTLSRAKALWEFWLEHHEVVDPETAGTVVATGVPSEQNHDRLRALVAKRGLSTFAFGELVGSGYLFLRRTGSAAEVWFYDYQEPDAPATRLAANLDEFIAELSTCALQLCEVLSRRGAPGWAEDPVPDFGGGAA